MPWANPVQKFSLAKLALLVGETVQAPARSSAVLMFKLTGGAIGDWIGVAACIGAAKARAKLKTRTYRIEHLMGRVTIRRLSSAATLARAGSIDRP